MEAVGAFLRAIPAAAVSPLSLIAYLAAVSAWVYINGKTKAFGLLMDRIQHVPPHKIPAVIEATFPGFRLPAGSTAQDYLAEQRQRFVYFGYLATLAAIIVVLAIALFNSKDRGKAADELFEKIYGAGVSGLMTGPSSEFMSAANIVLNGPESLKNAIAAMTPSPSKEELEGIVRQLVDGGYRSGEAINNYLHEKYGGGPLQVENDYLRRAASVLDKSYSDLADCYRKGDCAKGSHFSEMCKRAGLLDSRLQEVNEIAQKVPGVTFTAGGAEPIFGNGSIDVYFREISAPNVSYIANKVCKR